MSPIANGPGSAIGTLFPRARQRSSPCLWSAAYSESARSCDPRFLPTLNRMQLRFTALAVTSFDGTCTRMSAPMKGAPKRNGSPK